MTYISTPAQGVMPYWDSAPAPTATTPVMARPAPSRGFWRTLTRSLWRARQAQAEQEIARYIALNGGQLTDAVERDIMRVRR
jgi:hypothetical protein